eukprot:CAMPEP_0202491574 /NCGR_PEP_ID=MMETSP1361-20130828/8589_1 /ASSEMBLY_ACC=CAM_ASM_000849 /TAXON_ID=210615 /ORGANISM="Staurosira complex sp., Strain CCMP2646" /LENGTH=327 /DNA_ID=CAMNT_0049121645 /DNA_START=54 /DNA_END=1037 /DNA_ORIENTATION=+
MMNSNNSQLENGRGSKEWRDLSVPMEIEVRKDSAEQVFVGTEGPTEKRDAASLLLSVAAIASKEISVDGLAWNDEEQPSLVRPKATFANTEREGRLMALRLVDHPSDDEMEDLTLPPTDDRFAWNRIRAVSMDSEGLHNASSPTNRGSSFNLVTPESSPVTRQRTPRKRAGLRAKRKRAYSMDSADLVEKRLPTEEIGGRTMTKILRKKFSWKNYPELEAFLIANREEYLRHSALNYTIQQKQYNNRLTERLLELAAEQGYVFDEEDFSFVTVRDRIRCYFKSYVQSAKKRGVIIGYAARKAGLLTEEDLEKSAGIAGRIVLPSAST